MLGTRGKVKEINRTEEDPWRRTQATSTGDLPEEPPGAPRAHRGRPLVPLAPLDGGLRQRPGGRRAPLGGPPAARHRPDAAGRRPAGVAGGPGRPLPRLPGGRRARGAQGRPGRPPRALRWALHHVGARRGLDAEGAGREARGRRGAEARAAAARAGPAVAIWGIH